MSTLAQKPEMGDRSGLRETGDPGEVIALPDLETFSPCVGERFAVETATGGGEKTLELVEARALPPQPDAPRKCPFVLLFRGPADNGLGQGMVRLGHPRIGAIALFVVPVHGPDDCAYYEAIFS
jgi:hypothetical protein